jgi:hypothetical protein
MLGAAIAVMGLPWFVAAAPESGMALAVAPAQSHSLVMAGGAVSTTLAWVESTGSNSGTIRWTTLRDGRLTAVAEPAALDLATAGSVLGLACAVDPVEDAPRLVWAVRGRDHSRLETLGEDGARRLVFSSAGVLESPQAAYSMDGTGYLAWSETVGTESRVYIAREDGMGGWALLRAPSAERSHDLLPQLHRAGDGVRLWWYSVAGGETRARTLTLGPGGMQARQHVPLPGPANRWPQVFWPEGAMLPGAWWVEQTTDGEIFLESDPRRGTGAESLAALGSAGAQVGPVAVSRDGGAVKVWQEVSRRGAARLLVARDTGAPDELLLAGRAEEVAVAATTNWRHVAWLEPDAASGLMLVRYARLAR